MTYQEGGIYMNIAIRWILPDLNKTRCFITKKKTRYILINVKMTRILCIIHVFKKTTSAFILSFCFGYCEIVHIFYSVEFNSSTAIFLNKFDTSKKYNASWLKKALVGHCTLYSDINFNINVYQTRYANVGLFWVLLSTVLTLGIYNWGDIQRARYEMLKL